jgi:hypothetical protein
MEIKFGVSKAKFIGNGATSTYSIAFPYLKKTDISVTVYETDGATPWPDFVDFQWVNDSTIQLYGASGVINAPLGYEVWIERFSGLFGADGGLRVDFQDGATITETQLDLAYRQAYYVAQEALDEGGSIFLVASDLDSVINTATGSATAAAASATAAAGSATAAAGSASAASASATAAALSATNAAASATTAQNAVFTFGLVKANNLGDLASFPTARTNLGLGTASTPTFAGLTSGGNILPDAGNSRRLGSAGTGFEWISVDTRSVTIGNSGGTATLTFDAAHILAQRSGANAQTFRIYNTFTDANNNERAFIRYNANVLEIGHEPLGTGQARAIHIGTIGTGSTGNLDFYTSNTARWRVQGSSGHLLALTDNTFDIGLSGGNRTRNIYLTGGLGLMVKAGAVVDGDFTTPVDGFTAVDSTNSKLWVRIGGTWKSVVLT